MYYIYNIVRYIFSCFNNWLVFCFFKDLFFMLCLNHPVFRDYSKTYPDFLLKCMQFRVFSRRFYPKQLPISTLHDILVLHYTMLSVCAKWHQTTTSHCHGSYPEVLSSNTAYACRLHEGEGRSAFKKLFICCIFRAVHWLNI